MTKTFCDWCDNPCTKEGGLYRLELIKVQFDFRQADEGGGGSIAKTELCGKCVQKIADARDSVKLFAMGDQ